MKLKDHTLIQYLDRLASTQPAPGGGSSTAVVVSAGTALGEMVSGILLKRKSEPQRTAKLKELKTYFRKARKDAEKIIDQDAQAYEKVVKAYGTKKKGEARKKHIDAALQQAFLMMFELALQVRLIQNKFKELEKLGTKSIMNDVKVANAFLKAGFEGAYLTAKINADYIYSPRLKKNLENKLAAFKKR